MELTGQIVRGRLRSRQVSSEMERVVLLCCYLLSLSAQHEDLHQDLWFAGCDDTEAQASYSLDGDMYWYADYLHETGVEPQPDFIEHVTLNGQYAHAEYEKDLCGYNLKIIRKGLVLPLRHDPPSLLMIYPRTPLILGEQNSLLCLASGFYPAPLSFFWTRDLQNVSASEVSQALLQPDGTFSQISRLDLVPEQGQVYSCTVDHPGLNHEENQRRTCLWNVDGPASSLGPSLVCVLGVVLALLGVAIGTYFFIKGNGQC